MGVADSLAQIQSSCRDLPRPLWRARLPVDGGKRHPMSFIGSFRPICRCLHNLLWRKQYVGETKGYPSGQ